MSSGFIFDDLDFARLNGANVPFGNDLPIDRHFMMTGFRWTMKSDGSTRMFNALAHKSPAVVLSDGVLIESNENSHGWLIKVYESSDMFASILHLAYEFKIS